MEWPVVVAMVVGIPVILFPVAYVWYLNIGGLLGIIRQRARVTRAKPATGR